MTRTAIVCFCLLASIAFSLSLASLASASRRGSEGEGQPALSAATYRAVEEIHRLMGEGRQEQARESLLRLLPRIEGRPYEKAVVMRTLGYLHVSVPDYAEAIRCFEQALAYPGLPDGLFRSTQYDLAQLYMNLESFTKAVHTLEDWFTRAETPSAEAYLLLGSGYVQLQRYPEALGPLRKAIELAKTPGESWYQLLLAAHFELKDERACIQVLEEMVRRFPQRKGYWQQLASLLLDQQEDWRALSLLEAAHRMSLLTESAEIMNLVRLYAYLEVPYKAGRLLEEAMKAEQVTDSQENLALLTELWLQARETGSAAHVLETSAVRSEGNGQLYLRLGQVHYGAGNWSEAASALEKALDKGGLDREGEAWLLLGMTLYELDELDRAREAFRTADKDSRNRKMARQWLAFLGRGD